MRPSTRRMSLSRRSTYIRRCIAKSQINLRTLGVAASQATAQVAAQVAAQMTAQATAQATALVTAQVVAQMTAQVTARVTARMTDWFRSCSGLYQSGARVA
jgi:hypothetical protein